MFEKTEAQKKKSLYMLKSILIRSLSLIIISKIIKIMSQKLFQLELGKNKETEANSQKTKYK